MEQAGNAPDLSATITTNTTNITNTPSTTAMAEREDITTDWAARGQPWRTEPEIDAERQRYLTERRAIKAAPREGVFGFAGVRLSRADMEWLLATLDDRSGFHGPVDWSDERQRGRQGLDVRGADLSNVDLHGLPLANLVAESARTYNWGPLPSIEAPDPGVVRLDGANLAEAHLEGALFGKASLNGANLRGANLTLTSFQEAALEGACLDGAHGTDTYFAITNLTGASMREIVLERAAFHYTTLDAVDATGARLTACKIDARSMNHARLDDAVLERTSLRADTTDATFHRAHLEGATLQFQGKRCDLTDAHLERATLTGALENAILMRARLDGAALAGIIIAGSALDGACFDGADLSEVSIYTNDTDTVLTDVSFLKTNLRKAKLTRPLLRGASLDGADLSGAKIEGGKCEGASFVGANLANALFVEATPIGSSGLREHIKTDLSGADLRGANLTGAHLEGAILVGAHLEGADCTGANFDNADLSGAYLAGTHLDHAQFNVGTVVDDVVLQDSEHGGAFLGEARWGGAEIARTGWQTFTRCGEDREASRSRTATGERKERATRIEEYGAAVRFYRQLALALSESDVGLDAPEERYLYRAQVLQRRVFWHQRNYGRWGFSLMLATLSGYGYRLQRILVAYLAVLAIFAGLYLALGALLAADAPLTWQSALLSSLTAFHGRVFAMSFTLGSPQAWASAIEGICGLIIESVFIAMLTNKFFGK